MNEKFFDLKKEKQDKMINGAMKVFAQNGFLRASTDEMVKTAGVSKGLWFHYFDNKIGLYTFVTDYAIKYMIMELQRELTADASDYFDTTYGVEEVKMSVRRSYPYVPLFLSSLEQETNPEALEAVSEYLAVYKEKMNSVYEAVDRSRFASFVDPDIFDMTVKFTMKGILEEEYEKEVFDERRYMDRIRTFLEQMRKMTLRENAGEE
ncbi:MAG: TetR/AcrR family transcriptional regulator [Lachnospiraceae bacterium]|nr:TetR/AcrR family transcriptional regulator [Lachnospiraceae bacterium]MBQ6637676.1 TetR/AcrR family transcriptional regulator [Lachnospiraceae bacterium]